MSAFAPEFNNHYSMIAMPLGKVSKIEKPKFSKDWHCINGVLVKHVPIEQHCITKYLVFYKSAVSGHN